MLEAKNVSVRRDGKWLIRDISLALQPGQLTIIIGPNGAGKSTLLSVLAGDTHPDEGTALLHGVPLVHQSIQDQARARAVMWQAASSPPGLKVHDLIRLGRAPHGDGSFTTGAQATSESLHQTNLFPLASRVCATLSGGERQRVDFARTLCQMRGVDQPILLIDEPTSSLDLKQQYHLLQTVRQFVDQGGTCLAILHDIGLTRRFADHVIALKDGRLFDSGPPDKALTASAIAALFDLPPGWTATHQAI